MGLLVGVACAPKATVYSERNDAGPPETDAGAPDASDDAQHDSGTGTPRPDDGHVSPLCGELAPVGSTVPFSLVGGEGGAGPDDPGGGGAGGVSGAGGAGGVGNEPSGCTTTEFVVTCRGPARATFVEDSPAFVFADGNTLQWVGDASTVSAPAVAEGAEVFIDYWKQEIVNRPFCVCLYSYAVTMRETEGGDILWLGQNGSPTHELDAETLVALFGATARLELLCHTPSSRYDCEDVYYDFYEHVLETTPEQRVPYAARTRVESPRGTFDVIWASAVANATLVPNCSDGRGTDNRFDFSASRVAN